MSIVPPVHRRRASEAEAAQRSLNDRITSDFHRSISDHCSRAYIDRFVNHYLFRGMSLDGLRVLDAACGSGGLTEYLLPRGACPTGLDISPQAVESYARRFPACNAVCRSIFHTGFPDATFDCVAMGGALHHFHPDVSKAVEEVHRILKPGGMFCFCEPHRGSLPDVFRKLWYRCDRKYFEENEGSIDTEELLAASRGRFRVVSQHYGGNVAYLLVLQSLFLRIPCRLKQAYGPPLLFLESLLTPLQGRRLSFQTICQWQSVACKNA